MKIWLYANSAMVFAAAVQAPVYAHDLGLKAAVAAPSRTPANVVRDAARHPYAKEGSVDMVLTFSNVHNWMGKTEESVEEAFKAAFVSLKSGGVFGVVEHRRPAEMEHKYAASRSGYVHEAYVIKMALAAGFQLAGKSEINANPKDFADYELGVW